MGGQSQLVSVSPRTYPELSGLRGKDSSAFAYEDTRKPLEDGPG